MSGTGTAPAASTSSVPGLAATATGTLAWGSGAILVKLTSIGGLSLPFYRLWFGSVAVAAVVLLTRTPLAWRVARASLPGAVFFAANVSFFYAALKSTSVAEATFIGSLQPVLVLLAARWLFGERLTRGQLGWMVPALAGVATVVLGGSASGEGSWTGNALACAALLTWTGYWLASKRVRTTLSTVEYMSGLFFLASLLLTPLALFAGAGLAVPASLDWVWLGLLGLVPGLGHFLFNWAHRFVPASISSLVQAAVPVVATVGAYVILAEPLAWPQVLGGLVAVAAIGAICVSSARGGREVAEPLEG